MRPNDPLARLDTASGNKPTPASAYVTDLTSTYRNALPVSCKKSTRRLFNDIPLDGWQREVPYADKRRVDFLHDTGKALRYVEVKSVTYADAGVGLFPDAVSKRASDHLAALGADGCCWASGGGGVLCATGRC